VDIFPGESSGVTVGDYLGMSGESSGVTAGDYLRMLERGLTFRLAGEAWVYCKGDSLTKGGINHSHRLSHVKVTTP